MDIVIILKRSLNKFNFFFKPHKSNSFCDVIDNIKMLLLGIKVKHFYA